MIRAGSNEDRISETHCEDVTKIEVTNIYIDSYYITPTDSDLFRFCMFVVIDHPHDHFSTRETIDVAT